MINAFLILEWIAFHLMHLSPQELAGSAQRFTRVGATTNSNAHGSTVRNKMDAQKQVVARDANES